MSMELEIFLNRYKKPTCKKFLLFKGHQKGSEKTNYKMGEII